MARSDIRPRFANALTSRRGAWISLVLGLLVMVPMPKLTDREIEVLRLLATGVTNKEIAKTLFVSEATVKSHLAHIFTKLGVETRSRAIHVAQETGLI